MGWGWGHVAERWTVVVEQAGAFSSVFDRALPITVNDTTVVLCGPSTASTRLVYGQPQCVCWGD
jgi:hypothetical protein